MDLRRCVAHARRLQATVRNVRSVLVIAEGADYFVCYGRHLEKVCLVAVNGNMHFGGELVDDPALELSQYL